VKNLILCSTILLVTVLIPLNCDAQLPRERVVTDEPVDNIFWATTNIGLSTVRNLSAGNLNTTIVHTFGPVRSGIEQFYGLDLGANTRIGIDYGVSDRLSFGLGRMTFNKIVDIRGKYNILRQNRSGSMPLDLAVKGSAGINTISNINRSFSERFTYHASILAARKFQAFSFQISPMFAHFSTATAGNPNTLYGLGFVANYEINDRFAVSAEYLPVLGDRFSGTEDSFGVALNINTGGHIFQLFFTSSQWHNEQYIMANNQDNFWDGDLRFGFNIHRVFGLIGR